MRLGVVLVLLGCVAGCVSGSGDDNASTKPDASTDTLAKGDAP